MPAQRNASGRQSRLEIERNVPLRMNGFDLLRALADQSAALVFFDPQYRGVLDRQNYGNEGRGRERARAALPVMTEHSITVMLQEIQRVLRPSGHVILWVDKFIFTEGRHVGFFRHARHLKIVDSIIWNKLRPGMGRRARCYWEAAVAAQKEPVKAKGVWTDHRIADCWPEQSDRGLHPHAKPHQLTERLIRAVTKRGDLVVDPCAGSFGVLEACRLSRREFVGCDLVTGSA